MSRRRKTIDWSAVLDFQQAAHNIDIDVRGDWHPDPWDWPEIPWCIKHGREAIHDALDNTRCTAASPIDVPKENFGIRPALVMDPIDRLVYQALGDRLSGELIGSQPPWAYGWRLPSSRYKRGHYARNDYQWEAFAGHLNTLAGIFDYALKTDVVSFFASVDVDILADLISDRCGSGQPQEQILAMINAWGLVATRKGLPQRSFASAVLANAYMRTVDDLLAYYGRVSGLMRIFARNGASCRWMDDIWIFSNNEAVLRQAQVELQHAMRSIGLEMNLGKTDVLQGDELIRDARQIEHSAVDDALTDDPKDVVPLNELIDRLLERPEHASRTSIRFVTTRMRWHDQFDGSQIL